MKPITIETDEKIINGIALTFGCLWFVGVAAFWILVLVALFKLVTKYL